MKPKITKKQSVWLTNHGGRTINDVKRGKLGLYVLMRNEDGKDTKVYIPADHELVLKSFNHNRKFEYVELI